MTLEARGVGLARGGRMLCRDLSVACRPGENWAILGGNGSGKTTLLHALAGLATPDRGQVQLAGRDLAAYPARERARRLGVLFQDSDDPFPATVLETVLAGRHPHLPRWRWEGPEDRRRAHAALEALGLGGFGPRALTTLSGGERRRVDIATLLVQDPPVCLLDEPTNHLDVRHQVQVLSLIGSRAGRPGHLNIVVLHDVNLATRFCSHALLLYGDGGHSQGRLPEVLTRENLERLYQCAMHELRAGERVYYWPA